MIAALILAAGEVRSELSSIDETPGFRYGAPPRQFGASDSQDLPGAPTFPTHRRRPAGRHDRVDCFRDESDPCGFRTPTVMAQGSEPLWRQQGSARLVLAAAGFSV